VVAALAILQLMVRVTGSRVQVSGRARGTSFGTTLASSRGTGGVLTSVPAQVEVEQPVGEDEIEQDRPWIVIVWNDPINLMSYVTFVFRKLFGYDEAKATTLMLQVHHEGKAVVSGGTREKAEYDVSRLHAHGLWATMRQD
jgi:ATP-dependent Clp protease adaptor protein ClpS